ncbi:MAG: adenosylcobalamin-dependent ribonucleoside-diphosphate reductase [Chloroflexi bacterium]|nr:adenosylcobalamin-dependent ribonucleoside-diphosphate reductase [Chloroflexota bacterium]
MVAPSRRDQRVTSFRKTPIPADLADRHINITANARTVMEKRYLRRGEDGQPIETEQEMFWRVAYHVALAERTLGGDDEQVEFWARKFFDLLTNLAFFPNSPTFTGAGTPLGQLAACFVLAIEDDMGRTGSGIFETLRHAALIQQTGGGNGFSFSRLRPAGALVRSSNGTATGPVGFLRVYDQAFGEIAQGGCLTPDTLVFTEKGLLRLDEIVRQRRPGWQAHELTVSTDEGTRRSRQAYNNGIAPVLKVTTDAGLHLSGTHNHKVKILTENGPVWRRFDELEPGDAILVKLNEHRGETQSLRRPEEQADQDLAAALSPILDEEMAFFLGYMGSAGFIAPSANDHRFGVTVAADSDLIDEIPASMQRLFGPEVSIYQHAVDDDAAITFSIDSKTIKDYLILNGLDTVAHTEAQVPRLVRMSPRSVVAAFLRGLFEAESATSHHYPQISSPSKRLVDEVAVMVIGLGCPVRIAGVDHGETRHWTLEIHSPAGLNTWQANIGTVSSSRYAAWTDSEPHTQRSRLAIPQSAPVTAAPSTHARPAYPTIAHSEPIAGDDGYGYTQPIDDLWAVRVVTIEAAGEALTLDIEVDNNHTYLANGLVTHNSRRGANMAVLRVDHPDIREFIKCKTDENSITNFNISVGITDEFMTAVEEGTTFNLRFDGDVWETVDARELFGMIVKHAHHNGEPGVLFLDHANAENPVPNLYEIEATNPCGEQFLGPFENCCLGAVNLSQHTTENGAVDWDRLAESIATSTRFLDDVVTANAYVPAIPELRDSAERVRRIGLGIMGLADMMYAAGVRYGAPEGQEFASQVTEFLRYHAMKTSVELAEERGPFLAIKGSRYDPDNLQWTPPQPLLEHETSWGRPALDWAAIEEGIRQHGIRNGAQTTIAPTGTIATVSGCEGYGCEPVFALAYKRYVNTNAGNANERIALQYTSPLFAKALRRANLSEQQIDEIVREVNKTGSCQAVPDLPDNIRRVFVTAGDITAEEHIRMQAAMQANIDNAISKTCNFPSTATLDDVAQAYELGWHLGCKGLTVYVTGSREKVVLETDATRAERGKSQHEQSKAEAQPLPLFNEKKKPRPRRLPGKTYRSETPAGTTYITINENGYGEGQPFEVFMQTAKAGSEIAAVSEAMGRLISLILRIASPVSPRDRVKEVIRQLGGIGGGRQLGFGPNRIASLPDGIAQVLQEYLEESDDGYEEDELTAYQAAHQIPLNLNDPDTPSAATPVGDLCPECGNTTLIREEGCLHCYTCGYSEC